MRIWLVPLCELDNQRLLGAHNEVHMAAGLIKCGLKTGKMNTLVKRWCTPEGYAALLRYHTLCVNEMKKRGWTGHKTPFALPLEVYSQEMYDCISSNEYYDFAWPPKWFTVEEIEADRQELQRRQKAGGKL